MIPRSWLFSSYLLLAPHWAWGADMTSAPEPLFFLDKERGWFWRESQPEPKKLTAEAERPTRSNPPPFQVPPKPLPPEPLSAAWFRKNLEHYRDRAIDDPSPENVAAYYYLQRVMMDKAHRFTDVARQVVMSDPFLDENQRRPIATFAANETNRLAGIATEQALASLARQAGILFFFRSDCPYCHIQAPLLAVLEKRFGFKVYAVSLDGRPMPGDLYLDFHTDRGQANLLGVVSTPAMF
ncbi:MAG TPA: conjugal transfer protein TraF, partial [Methylococcaceae bacterium]|nr:conjugal transfer protein TraF [Methylococcaceae bacterium]